MKKVVLVVRRGTRRIAVAIALLALSAGFLGGPVSSANAAPPVDLGEVHARLSDHQGRHKGTSPTLCITYAPPDTPTRSEWVSAGSEALTGHTYWESGNCPESKVTDKELQSSLGVTPSAETSGGEDGQFLLASLTHYNNGTSGMPESHFTGTMSFELTGFDPGARVLDLHWSWEETVDIIGGSCPFPRPEGTSSCDDEFKFPSGVSTGALVKDGVRYDLVIGGFELAPEDGNCPAAPSGDVRNNFLTKESESTTGCIYASLALADPDSNVNAASSASASANADDESNAAAQVAYSKRAD